VLSVLLRYTDSDYPFGIFKFFLLKNIAHPSTFMIVIILWQSSKTPLSHQCYATLDNYLRLLYLTNATTLDNHLRLLYLTNATTLDNHLRPLYLTNATTLDNHLRPLYLTNATTLDNHLRLLYLTNATTLDNHLRTFYSRQSYNPRKSYKGLLRSTKLQS
jgi:hypothetical protein